MAGDLIHDAGTPEHQREATTPLEDVLARLALTLATAATRERRAAWSRRRPGWARWR
jgi:hypothetical protein